MRYTVKQLADLAGVTVRALHYYDEIGLLTPTRNGANGYRYYSREALLRLQQILFFRELDFPLAEIQRILDQPTFDLVEALGRQRAALAQRIERLQRLIETVDQTTYYLKGEAEMSDERLFGGFSEEKQQAYEQEATERWGDEVKRSAARWKGYSASQKAAILAQGEQIYRDLLAAMPEGPTSPTVQQLIGEWHRHLGYFYEPTMEYLRGLADLYTSHPDFIANFQKLHPDMPEFLASAIRWYCEELEEKKAS